MDDNDTWLYSHTQFTSSGPEGTASQGQACAMLLYAARSSSHIRLQSTMSAASSHPQTKSPKQLSGYVSQSYQMQLCHRHLGLDQDNRCAVAPIHSRLQGKP